MCTPIAYCMHAYHCICTMIAYGHKSEEGRYDPLLLLVYYSGKKFIKTVSCLKYVYKAFEMTAVFVSLQVYYSTQLNVAPYLSSVSSCEYANFDIYYQVTWYHYYILLPASPSDCNNSI